MSTTSVFVTLIHRTCPSCGMLFGITQDFENRRRDDSREFYCPHGHRMSYHESSLDRAEKAAKRAQELLEQERRRNESLRIERDQIELRRRAEAGAKTKLKNRIKHGVCPCCNRTFKQLAEHMKTKHPEYVKESAK